MNDETGEVMPPPIGGVIRYGVWHESWRHRDCPFERGELVGGEAGP